MTTTMLYGPLIGLIWIGWCIYWYAASHNVKTVRRMESRGSRAAHIIPFTIAIVLLATPDRGACYGAHFIQRSLATYWAGVALLVMGLGFSIWARRRLGRNWSGTVTLKNDHELVRTGPYRWVRHPIYTGILLGIAGSALSLGEWRGLASIALATFAFWLKIRLEERWMIETFGDSYRRYRTQVRALIPFVL